MNTEARKRRIALLQGWIRENQARLKSYYGTNEYHTIARQNIDEAKAEIAKLEAEAANPSC